MGFDKGRRGERGGRGRDKRDGFGEDTGGSSFGGGGFGERSGGDRFGGGGGGGGFGGGDRFGGGGGGGGYRGGGGGGVPRRRRRRGGGMPPQVVGEAKGVVKFFNGQKGFGFIVRDDGGEDVFVHISAVEQAGLTGPRRRPAARLHPRRPRRPGLGDRPQDRGRSAAGRGARPPRDARGPQRELTGEKASGTVKFFNATKGFGFITRDDGQPDAFVHISAVERAGMISLNEGDRIEFELEVDRRGKTAAVNLVPIQ